MNVDVENTHGKCYNSLMSELNPRQRNPMNTTTIYYNSKAKKAKKKN